MSFIVVVGIILGTLVLGVLSIIVWESMSRVGGAITNPFAGMGAGVGKVLPWVVGIVLAIILYNMVGLPDLKQTNIDIGFWLVALVLLGTAVYGAVKNKGDGAVWVTRIVVVGGLLFVGAHLLFGAEAPKVLGKIQEDASKAILEDKPRVVEQRSAPAQQQQLPIVKEAEWEGGVPVVGHWSRTFQIPIGCATRYSNGNGTEYRIRLRMYGERDWREHVPGTFPEGNEIQFMLLKEGTGIPFTMKCS